MAGRETRIPKGLVPHRRSGIHRGFSYIAHKRRNAGLKGLRRVHTPPQPPNAHTAAHTPKHGAFRTGGWYHYPRSVLRGSETLRGRVSERQTLPLLGLGRVCSRRTQKAFGTAMRLCASLFRRRRGPAGLRCSVAGSYVIPVSFAVRYRCIQEQREKFAVGVAWFLLAA